MNTALFVVLVCVAFFAALMVALGTGKRRRLNARLRRQFGRPPEQINGLRNAEGFWAAYKKALPTGQGDAAAAQAAPFDVDDLTWSDLDLDDIFARLNACVSATGDVRLYTVLRRLTLDGGAQADALAKREVLVGLLARDEALCHRLRYQLAKLGRFDGNNLENVTFETKDLRLPRPWLYVLLGLLPFATIPFFWVNAIGAGIALLALISSNYYVYTMVRGKVEGGFRAVRYLAAALACAGRVAGLLNHAAPDTAAELRRHTARFVRLRAGIGLLVFNNTMEDNFDFDPFCFILLPLLAYAVVARQLAGTQQNTLALYTLLGEIDLAQGVLSTRRSLPLWCRPAFTEDDALDCENLYHLMLDEAVPNSARFESDVLLTGSNASGKSTFIKALAIGCLTAQALNTCTATALTLRRGAVATSMAVADSVVDGDSYFVAEIKSMRRLIRTAAAQPFSWFFIDEILKGTNTVERIAASAAVLRHLHAMPCLCFAATHDIELTAILADEYENYHFRETVDDDGVYFSYKLRPGPATTRNAILLLERMDYPQPVTANARALVTRFEAEGDWAAPPAQTMEVDNE